MIQREITKNDEINKSEDEKEKKSNMKNIVFSQVFSYSNNMVEFNINREDIISLVDKLCKKYEIEKEMVDSIIDNVNILENNKNKKEEDKNDKIKEEKIINDNKTDEEKKDKGKEEKEEKDGNKPKKVEIIKDYFSSNSDTKEGEEEKKDK